jgi:hypothetical protein
MKKLFVLMILSSLSLSAMASDNNSTQSIGLLPRCFNRQEPTRDIVRGTFFESGDNSTYLTHYSERDPDVVRKLGEDYVTIIKANEPRFITSHKETPISALDESCLGVYEYALVDYSAKLSTGEICADTYVTAYTTQARYTGKCVAMHIPFAPFLIFSPIVDGISALDDLDSTGCATEKCHLDKELKHFGLTAK